MRSKGRCRYGAPPARCPERGMKSFELSSGIGFLTGVGGRGTTSEGNKREGGSLAGIRSARVPYWRRSCKAIRPGSPGTPPPAGVGTRRHLIDASDFSKDTRAKMCRHRGKKNKTLKRSWTKSRRAMAADDLAVSKKDSSRRNSRSRDWHRTVLTVSWREQDTPAGVYSFQATSLQRWQRFVAAGFTPLEALANARSIPRALFRNGQPTSTVAKEKLADCPDSALSRQTAKTRRRLPGGS